MSLRSYILIVSGILLSTFLSGARNSLLPRIAVPECPQKEHLEEMVRQAGCIPVEVPFIEDVDKPLVKMKDVAFGWDGAVMPDEWVSSKDEYSLVFYKAVADLNVPHVGSSVVSRDIDQRLRRLPGKIGSMGELATKARTYHRAKALMDRMFTIDTHCDLPDWYSKGASVGVRSEQTQCSIPKMGEGHLDAQVLISFLWQGPLDEYSSKKAVERNFRQIEAIKADVGKYPELCGLATTAEEALRLKSEGRKAFFIGIENGYGIGLDLANIKRAREAGVIYITLCHFRDNAICNTSSRHGSDPSKGLTDFGKKVVEEMNRQGIMIDLSHPSAGTFWDCIALSKAPVICSHSGAKAIYGHDRGLDDRQLRALAENGGVIQVYLVPEYLGRPRQEMSLDDFMAHFNHCVEVAGPEHVGIGSDFDGGGGVIGCGGDNDLINITVRMLEHGYSPSQIEGFWGGNFLRVLRGVQALKSE